MYWYSMQNIFFKKIKKYLFCILKNLYICKKIKAKGNYKH